MNIFFESKGSIVVKEALQAEEGKNNAPDVTVAKSIPFNPLSILIKKKYEVYIVKINNHLVFMTPFQINAAGSKCED